MARARDNQKTKLYRAEGFAFTNTIRGDGELDANGYTTGELPDAATAQAYVNECLSNPAIRATFGRAACAKVEVYYGGVGASGSWANSRIRLGTHCRSKWVALHELAHVITGRFFGDNLRNVEVHGPQFAAVYLYLVRVMLGDRAATDLRASFELHGVRFVKMWEPDPA